MHLWNDDWPYWNDLYEAEKFISSYVYKHSWCRVMMKEKYGTLKYEWVLPPRSALFTRPWTCIRIPFLWTKYNKETKKFHFVFELSRLKEGYPIWRWCDSWIHYKWEQYGWKTLDKAIQLACRKWPKCRKEIYSDFIWRKY